MNASERLKEMAKRTPIGLATWNARERCQDNRIGVSVKQGLSRVALFAPKNGGSCDIVPLSGWCTQAQAIEFLNDMEAVTA